MKEFQKGILDNDRVITENNVQKMGEVIALCAIKTVIVRGGKDLHNLYKGLLRDVFVFLIGVAISFIVSAFAFPFVMAKYFNNYKNV